ncbi:MAG: hypothetical protein ACRCUC_11185 [Aestuariivirga sp.]
MHHFPTARAAEAIIAQLAYASSDERTFCAKVDGRELEFSVHFTTDWRRERGDYGMGNTASCEIVGAWAEDPDTGAVAFAGNALELEALLGERLVAEWASEISQSVTEKGKW